MVDAVVFDTHYPSARAIADVLESKGVEVLRVASVASPGSFLLEFDRPASTDALLAEVGDALGFLVLDQSGLFQQAVPPGTDDGLFDMEVALAVRDVTRVVGPQLALARALLPLLENTMRPLVVTHLDRIDHGRRPSAGQSLAATAAARIGALGASHHGHTVPWLTLGTAVAKEVDMTWILPEHRAQAAVENHPTHDLAAHVIAALAKLRPPALQPWLDRPHDTLEVALGLGLMDPEAVPKAGAPDETSLAFARAYRRQFTGD